MHLQNSILDSVIVVTGGAGFIGSHLVEELLKYRPAKIIVLDNLSRGKIENIQSVRHDPRVVFIRGDIRDTELLEKCIAGAHYVFHMAALRINACASNPCDGFDVMLKSTFDLVELSVKHKVKKVVYSSSASVYGLAQHFPTPESDHPYDNQTFYGGAKLWGEQLFRSYQFMYGLSYTALRYFNVYGPRMDMDGKYTEVMIRWLNCIQEGVTPAIHGDGSNTMDFIYVTDVAKANVAALLSPVTDQVFNIGSGKETSLKELLQLLLKVNNSSLMPEFLPENSINPVKKRLADASKAKLLLNFEASVDLNRGLRELCNWYYNSKLKTTI